MVNNAWIQPHTAVTAPITTPTTGIDVLGNTGCIRLLSVDSVEPSNHAWSQIRPKMNRITQAVTIPTIQPVFVSNLLYPSYSIPDLAVSFLHHEGKPELLH